MIRFAIRVATLLGAAALATTAFAGKVDYKGPTMDFSKVQKEFRIGFLGDEASQDIIARNQCLKDYVEAAYQVPAKMFTFKDYAGTMESMLGGNLDYAWFGSSGYAGIYLKNPKAVVPVLTRMQPTGDTGYYSVMVARKDSGIDSLADLKGKRAPVFAEGALGDFVMLRGEPLNGVRSPPRE